MKTLLQKLKLENQNQILILNEPEGFGKELAALSDMEILYSSIKAGKVEFVLIFVTTIEELENQLLTVLHKLHEDAILWIAHPRKVSKTLYTDITNDYDWTPLIRKCYHLANHITVNDDWEAVRFRRLEYVKSKNKKKTENQSE
ncbi:hypothetical protein [Robertkochia solimangrovi]|uniref:hypothetical protein n=1 Tax=Robertkochia solimangrovi TaxID=2213046 RepID=UPI00117D0170|nr:hypothetical protein [Robertkochia solimangrovi]TRZ41790.1 hypothetical protein DMZ48_15705 [Robertkochia solimangrovi]